VGVRHHRRLRCRGGRRGPAQDNIGGTLTAAKANTANTVLIPQVATGVDAVLAEGLEHHLFLGRVLGKVKS
jgi:hypothetical protein